MHVLILFFFFLISRRHTMGRRSITHFPDIFWIHYHISGVTARKLIHHPHHTIWKRHEDPCKLLDFKSSMCWPPLYFARINECHQFYLLRPPVVWRNWRFDKLQIISNQPFNLTLLFSFDPCNHCFWALLQSDSSLRIIALVPEFKENHCAVVGLVHCFFHEHPC